MDNTIKKENVSIEDRKIIANLIHFFYLAFVSIIIVGGLSHNSESTITFVAVLTIIAATATCFTNGFKELYTTLGIVILLSVVFNVFITKETLQKNRLDKVYSSFVYQNENYANTENAKNIKKALEDYNPENTKIAFDSLKKYDQNISQDLDKVMNLISAVKAITPELIPELKVAMNDNFVSIDEYNVLKQKAIKNISSKKLTNEQLVLLGSIK